MKPGDIDLSDPDAFSDGFPHEYFAMLRNEEPVSWNESRFVAERHEVPQRGFWSVTRHADLVHVSRHPELFSSAMGGVQMHDVAESTLESVRSMLLSMDPPDHMDYRRLVNRGFTPNMVRQLEPRIRAAATEVVDRVIDRLEVEFVTGIAMHLPMLLICELMGVPAEDQQKIFDWSNRMVALDDPDYQDPSTSREDLAGKVWLYSSELAAKKRAEPDETLMSRYANGEVDGEATTEIQLNNFFVLLAVAGNETTRNATSHTVRLMDAHREQWDLLLSEIDAYLPGAIDEVLRYEPPVYHFRRTATEDTELGGVTVRRGEKVVMWYPSANRDDAVWGNPDEFDITRDSSAHLTFGIGEHFCLGANLARMQLDCILKEVAHRMPDIHLTGPMSRIRSNLVAGVKSMPVAW